MINYQTSAERETVFNNRLNVQIFMQRERVVSLNLNLREVRLCVWLRDELKLNLNITFAILMLNTFCDELEEWIRLHYHLGVNKVETCTLSFCTFFSECAENTLF